MCLSNIEYRVDDDEKFVKAAIKEGEHLKIIEIIEHEIKKDFELRSLVLSGFVLVLDKNERPISGAEYLENIAKKIAANKNSLKLIRETSARIQKDA